MIIISNLQRINKDSVRYKELSEKSLNIYSNKGRIKAAKFLQIEYGLGIMEALELFDEIHSNYLDIELNKKIELEETNSSLIEYINKFPPKYKGDL